jgi:hypothetical protein
LKVAAAGVTLYKTTEWMKAFSLQNDRGFLMRDIRENKSICDGRRG